MAVVGPVRRAWIGLEERALQWTSRVAIATRRAPARAKHLLTGERGETAALFFLRRNGYIITARNWKSAKYRGDIDLVGWEGDTLCFIEVKTRSLRNEAFTAESAVNREKRDNIRRLAALYARQVNKRPAAQRFDVLSIYMERGGEPDFQLIRGAFALRRSA